MFPQQMGNVTDILGVTNILGYIEFVFYSLWENAGIFDFVFCTGLDSSTHFSTGTARTQISVQNPVPRDSRMQKRLADKFYLDFLQSHYIGCPPIIMYCL